MKPFSKVKTDYICSKTRREMNTIDFLENNCEIHGWLDGTVYQYKNNGEAYSYPYSYHPKYAATVLSRRPECVSRCAAANCNLLEGNQ